MLEDASRLAVQWQLFHLSVIITNQPGSFFQLAMIQDHLGLPINNDTYKPYNFIAINRKTTISGGTPSMDNPICKAQLQVFSGGSTLPGVAHDFSWPKVRRPVSQTSRRNEVEV